MAQYLGRDGKSLVPQMNSRDIRNTIRNETVQQAAQDPMAQIMQMMQAQQQAQELEESPMRIAMQQLQMEAQRQEMEQNAGLYPGRIEGQNLDLQRGQFDLEQAQQRAPFEMQSLQQGNQNAQQAYQQNQARFPMEMYGLQQNNRNSDQAYQAALAQEAQRRVMDPLEQEGMQLRNQTMKTGLEQNPAQTALEFARMQIMNEYYQQQIEAMKREAASSGQIFAPGGPMSNPLINQLSE